MEGSWSDYRSPCRDFPIEPVDLSCVLKFFEPFGTWPKADGIAMIVDMVRMGTIVFDGEEFFIGRDLDYFRVPVPRQEWTDEQIMAAPCLHRAPSCSARLVNGYALTFDLGKARVCPGCHTV